MEKFSLPSTYFPFLENLTHNLLLFKTIHFRSFYYSCNCPPASASPCHRSTAPMPRHYAEGCLFFDAVALATIEPSLGSCEIH